MEVLKPNQVDCKGCYYFLKKGSMVADRFPIFEDTCLLKKNWGKNCEGVKTMKEAFKKEYAAKKTS